MYIFHWYIVRNFTEGRIFKQTYLDDYFELKRLPHHSSDVFFHGELISDQFTGVQALCAPILGTSETRNCLESSEKYDLPELEICHPPRLGPIDRGSWCSSGYHFESSLTLTSPNRCAECPDASKTTGNQLPMNKYVGVVVRKSFQLEIVTEIGPFENFGPQSNFVQYINEKLAFKKIKTIFLNSHYWFTLNLGLKKHS